MSTHHTSGPWMVDEMGDVVANEATIALICLDERMIDEGEAEANAYLIAESPTLLSLAERWAALDGGAWAVDRHAREKAELLADTRAAIARAKGG